MRLFISYSRDDSDWVHNLYSTLRDDHDVWMDKRIVVGTDWWEAICENIESCNGFLYIITPKSASSIYCQTELQYALDLGKYIIPFMLKDTTYPPVLNDRRIQFERITPTISMDRVLYLVERALRKIHDRDNTTHAPLDHIPRPEVPKSDAELSEIEPQLSVTDVSTLIETCREYIHRNQVNEARAFLYQIDLLLLDYETTPLRADADFLGALLSIQAERIPEAKEQLLDIIESYPDHIEAKLEYIELCDRIPAPSDEAEPIETTLREQAGDHPRLKLIDLVRKHNQREMVPCVDLPDTWTDDIRLNARYMCQYALICHANQNYSQRDELIDRWANILPNSPHPHYFRVIFKVADAHSATKLSPKEYTSRMQKVLEFSQSEKILADSKDPLSARSQIHWSLLDIQLGLSNAVFSDERQIIHQLSKTIIQKVEQCYFDAFIDGKLIELLSMIPLDIGSWQSIAEAVQKSTVKPSQTLIDRLFIQTLKYDRADISTDIKNFLDTHNRQDLQKILTGIDQNDGDSIASALNNKSDIPFAFLLLQSLAEPRLISEISEQLTISDDYYYDILYVKIIAYVQSGNEPLALKAIEGFPIDKAGMHSLNDIAHITSQSKQWRLFIPVARKLLQFPIPHDYRVYLQAELALGYFQEGDDTNAILYARQALSQADELGKENAQNLLHISAAAYTNIGQPERACDLFQQYEGIERSFALLLEEATLHLKTYRPDRHDKAIALLLRAFEETDHYNDELYLSALMLLTDLDNAGKIPSKDEEYVADGLFIKLGGFRDGWFYVGKKEKALGASAIEPQTENYDAVIGKHISELVNWAADKYSDPQRKRKILHISTPPSFLSWRTMEIMQEVASIGNAPIWTIQILNEDNTLNEEALRLFQEEQFKSSNEFFKTYIASPLPFAFLCAMEGTLTQAIAKIASEQKGFIHCNTGSSENISSHENNANHVLNGKVCVIGGLASVMLAEGELIQTLVSNIPNLKVPTSVIRLLRTIAEDIDRFRHSIGRGAFIDGKFTFRSRDKEQDEALRARFLKAAEILDHDAYKVISQTYSDTGNKNMDTIVPDYMFDPLRWAKQYDAYVLTDDTFLLEAYRLETQEEMPPQLSSISLIRAITDRKKLDWTDYLKYFAYLSGYRFKLLPVSVDDLYNAVFPTTSSGLATPNPSNLGYLNLPLTLSKEYGVDDKTVVGILSEFFVKLIHDDSIPHEIADEIIARSIQYGLIERDRRLLSRLILQVCDEKMNKKQWLSNTAKEKTNHLHRRLIEFANGHQSLIVESHLLLRSNMSASDQNIDNSNLLV